MAKNSERYLWGREDLVRATQLRAGEPKTTERGRAEPVSGGTETLGRLLPAAKPHRFWGHKQGHDS